MKRFLIGGITAAIVLVVTLVIAGKVNSDIRAAGTAEVEAQVLRAAAQYEQISRLKGIDFANLALGFAQRGAMAGILEEPNEVERRKLAFTQVESINRRLENESRKADIVAILDGQGKVIARDLNAEAMYGEDLAARYPAVKAALKGEAVKDIWNLAGRTTQVGLAPIRKGDTVLGALLIGNVEGFRGVRLLRDLLGAEVGLFHEGKVQTASFVTEDGKENGNKTRALSDAIFSGDKLAEAALAGGRTTEVRRLTLDGEDYLAAATPVPGNASDRTSGAVIVISLAGVGSMAGRIVGKIWLLGLVGLIAVLVAAVLTAKRFITPLDKIELGVAEIINGNIDYTFEPVGADFEGLSNGLNVMLARLLGREEPSDEEAEEEDANKWKAEQMVIEEGDGAPAGANVAALSQESEAAYYPRLFNEYVNALRGAGVRADGISVPMFTAKLRLVEGGLRRKWNCRMVRFQLASKGGELVFQAVKIA